MKKHVFTFMGTGAGCGVPAFFCDCPACREARENPAIRRGDCGVMVRGMYAPSISDELRARILGTTADASDAADAFATAGESDAESARATVDAPGTAHLEAASSIPSPASAAVGGVAAGSSAAVGGVAAVPAATTGDLAADAFPAGTLLIDTPPDTRHQLIRENVRAVDQLLFTHCHSDHVSGLCEMEYMMQLRTRHAIPTFGSAITLNEINTEFHYMDYALDEHVLEPFDTHEFDGVRYTALPVTHAAGTYGYLIETDDTRLFYASDTGRLPAQTAKRIQGIDVLAMDATYWKSCPAPQAHHCVQSCIEEGLELGAKKIYLTHLAMHYVEPITLHELNIYLQQYNGRVEVAADGLSFAL